MQDIQKIQPHLMQDVNIHLAQDVLYYSCKIGMVNRSNENAPSLSVAVRTNIHTYHTTKESDMSIPLKPKIPPERPLEIKGEAGTKVQIQRGSAKSLSKKKERSDVS